MVTLMVTGVNSRHFRQQTLYGLLNIYKANHQ